MNNKSAIVGLVILIVLMGGLLYYVRGVSTPTTTPVETSQDEAAVRTTVTSFGNQLKNVSLLAPNAAEQITNVYAPYVAPELLQTWTASTTQAPGRLTSSPWPEHIEIDSVTPQGSVYRVIATVVEMTNATTTPASLLPVYMELENRNGAWLITKWQPNPYTED